MWLGGMRSADYVNAENNIIWSADPANTLKPWAYKHLFTATGNKDAGGASASTAKEMVSDGGPARDPAPPTCETIGRTNVRETASSNLIGSNGCGTAVEPSIAAGGTTDRNSGRR
jgi:hypothetical protein